MTVRGVGRRLAAQVGLADYAYNRTRDPGCNADYADLRRRRKRTAGDVKTLPRTGPRDVAVAVERRAGATLSGDTAALARAVDPRCSDALVVRYTPQLAKALLGLVDGADEYRDLIEEQFDLSLARMSAARLVRSFVIWPPVVHRFHDGYGRPDDGYGMNSSQFITSWLELKTNLN